MTEKKYKLFCNNRPYQETPSVVFCMWALENLTASTLAATSFTLPRPTTCPRNVKLHDQIHF